MLNRISISQKLGLLVAIALLAYIGSQGFSLITERENAQRLSLVEEELFPTLELSTINLGELSLIELLTNNAVATGDEQQLEQTAQHYQRIKDNLRTLEQLNQAQRTSFRELANDLDAYYNNALEIAAAIIDGSADFSRIGDQAARNVQRLDDLRQSMNRVQEQTRQEFTEALSHTAQASSRATTIALVILAASAALLIVLGVIISRSIIGGLKTIIDSLRDMATGEGDLTARLSHDGRDELSDLVAHFNQFVEKLHRSFHTISEDVEGLNTVSRQLAVSSNQNLERIQDQSEAIASVRVAIEQLVRSVEEVAGFANNASDQTQDATQFVERGQKTVANNVDTIRQLASDIESTSELVNRFEEFSAKVGGLLDTIQNVAEQTNLLALNAAIEAARAGEHGRGFAVVADEVRGLAVRTKDATGEIHEVISELRSLSGNAVEAMQHSVTRAREGVEATTESGEILDRILANTQSINAINEQIAAATYEQTSTFNEVTRHITEIDDNAEKVTASTRDLDAASQDIERISQGLNEVSSQFRS